MACQLVIFDCDGVLVDSEKLGNDVFAEMLSAHGHVISGAESARRFRGMEFAKILETLQHETGIQLPDSFESSVRSRMSAVFSAELKPVSGAKRLIESMQVPFCVASSGPRKKIEENLHTTGLHAHFEGKIFSGYDVKSWKPDPGLFLAAAKHFNVAPKDCVVVEDSFVGVTAGVAANMTVLGLSAAVNGHSLDAAKNVFSSLNEIHAEFVLQGLARR